jgi:predicted nuclease of predicted toxin-antitoxin system
LKLLIDNQLPIALARYLTGLSWTSIHVSDIGLAAADDIAIWQYAIKNNLIIVTKDSDLSKRSKAQGCIPPQIIWLRCGNCCKNSLFLKFASAMPDILRAIAAGQPVCEIH